MDALADVETDTILSGTSDWIGPDVAARLAHHPLESIETEFPHHVRSIDGPDGVERPTERHPVFYGCYDWHSAVHSHWALVRQLRLLDAFLPDVTAPPHDALLEPARVESDPDDGVALHLVGLNVSKAWAMAGLAAALDGHRYAEAFERSAERHAERGLDGAFTDDYAGSHWLSSFVLYLLTRNEGGIAPE